MLAKIKLNSFETLMSRALIDLDISHEEFKTIVNEIEKYEQMKESIRNIKSRNELSEILEKIIEMHRLEKIYIFCVYKMVDINAETFAKESFLWLRIKYMGRELDIKNIFDLVDKEIKDKWENYYPTEQQIRKYKRHGSEFIKDVKYMYAQECIILPMIMHCSVATPDLNLDLINMI